MGRLRGWVIGVLVTVLIGGTCAATAGAVPVESSCAIGSGREFTTATPESQDMDPARLASAVQFATERNRLNIKIFRNNCLIGSGPNNAATGQVPWNVWSVTKSVVSLIAGIAWDQGKLDTDAPIGRYLPPAWAMPPTEPSRCGIC